MSRTTMLSRWATPRRPYKGGWHQNPWINAVFSAAQARGETDAQSNEVIQDRQQKAAMRTWENEGGSLGTQQSIRR